MDTDTSANPDALQAALDRIGLPAHAIVVPTPWDIGPVAAFLFASDPVTLIDSGVNTPEGVEALRAGFRGTGIEPTDVARVIVTHGHTDHWGGSVWIQEQSACEVLLHPADIAMSDPASWRENDRKMFAPLGFSDELISELFGGEPSFDFRPPMWKPLVDGAVFTTGDARLRIEHHPGHSLGHVWVVEETTGAIFVGDYFIADHPTNAGLELDPSHPTGRAPMLELYNAGLRELSSRRSPVLLPGHGPPITDHAERIERRLAKTDRRTRHVLRALDGEPRSALDVGRKLYGGRAEQGWEIMSDLVGRLDLLVAEGRATARLGEDAVWYFTA